MTARPAAKVGLIDYGAGNMQSLANALEHVGADVARLGRGSTFEDITHIVLPGVGAFGHCASRLEDSGLVPALSDWVLGQRRPLLGICVGMQLLTRGSEESPGVCGLGWLAGGIKRLVSDRPGVRIPHVGWNDVRFNQPWGEFSTGTAADFYFDHSFAYTEAAASDVLANCVHGVAFCAAVRRENVIGVQFHPEKSQTAGQAFLRAFLELSQC